LNAWCGLSTREQVRLLGLVIVLPIVAIRLSLFGMPGQTRSRVVQTSGHDITPERLAELVRIAGTRGPIRCACLPQAVVLARMLRARGLPADIRIGVARNAEGLKAHAWVELEGRALGHRDNQTDTFGVLELSGTAP
jgi:hypothetical protein